MMQILAFSDMHRNHDLAHEILENSRKCDIVIGAGDFATRGIGLSDTFDVLKEISVPVILVAGNHETPGALDAEISGHANFTLLHGSSCEVDGVCFFGVGGEIPRAMEESWNHFLDEGTAADICQACPNGAVLVTHAPPFGTTTDVAQDRAHVGSRTVRDTIITRKPRLALCGHIHNSWGAKDVIEGTPVHNLGPSLNWFSL